MNASARHPSWRNYTTRPVCLCPRCSGRYLIAQRRLSVVLCLVLIAAVWIFIRSL